MAKNLEEILQQKLEEIKGLGVDANSIEGPTHKSTADTPAGKIQCWTFDFRFNDGRPGYVEVRFRPCEVCGAEALPDTRPPKCDIHHQVMVSWVQCPSCMRFHKVTDIKPATRGKGYTCPSCGKYARNFKEWTRKNLPEGERPKSRQVEVRTFQIQDVLVVFKGEEAVFTYRTLDGASRFKPEHEGYIRAALEKAISYLPPFRKKVADAALEALNKK